MDNNLTILIPLKGRDDYTVRCVNYLNFIECPYRILFADGGKNSKIQELLENKDNFPNLNYEYIRYPYDATLADFYKKMTAAASLVKTPFVYQYDNDDFFITETVQKCVDFLIENPDYNSAKGRKFDFFLSKEIYGDIHITHEMYTKYPNPIIGETVRDRLADQCAHFHANYHNIRRTKNFQATCELIEISDFSNYRFAHQAESFLNIVWGKSIRQIDGVHLFHQGSSPSCGSEHFPPQEEWIMAEYWKNDFVGMMNLFGTAIHYFDDVPLKKARNIFADAYLSKLPDLKDLLTDRIKECKKEKINENKIESLLECISKYENLKDFLISPKTKTTLPDQDEINAIRFFLKRESPHHARKT